MMRLAGCFSVNEHEKVIRADLDVSGTLRCDATSLTLELGGVAE